MSLKKLSFIGAVSYNSVFLAAPTNGGPVVALKTTTIERSDSLRREATFLQELRGCPYVIQGFGTDMRMEDGGMIYNLVMEYASGGSLLNMIKYFNGNMSEPFVASLTCMLLRGLSEIHQKDIVHCDIKPANILVLPERGSSLLKIADFGSSKKIWEATNENRCTLVYAPPEAVLRGLNEKAGDIWALGCIVVEMITGKPIWRFWDSHELRCQILLDKPKIPENISEHAKDFLKRCLYRDPYKRWSAEMLLDHPFIVENLKSNSSEAMHPSKGMMRPWISENGMIEDVHHKPYELFPMSESHTKICGRPFILPDRAFGRIY